MRAWMTVVALGSALALGGCTAQDQRQADAKAKESGRSVARELGKAANNAAHESKKAAEKAAQATREAAREAREGWNQAERERRAKK